MERALSAHHAETAHSKHRGDSPLEYNLATSYMKLGLEWKNVKATSATPDQRGIDRLKLNEREPSVVFEDPSKLRIRGGGKSNL
jgi:hypothetical protein